MNVKAIILHLARAAGRRPQVERLRAELPIRTEVLEAVDGSHLSDRDFAAMYRPFSVKPQYAFEISRNEAACFLSHRMAWQKILDDGLDSALVVEDDAAISRPLFDKVLRVALACANPEDFVRFPHRERHEPGPVVHQEGGVRLVEPRLPALGMVMQLVGHEAARRLLAASHVFDRPVDSFVQLQWLHGTRVLTARPIVIREISAELGGSVIHMHHPGLAHKLVHELRRPLIRLAVRRANERWRRWAA